MVYVIKRDGTKQEFIKQKIINAINAAGFEVDGELFNIKISEKIANYIEKKIKKVLNMTVETIQDEIENLLMKSKKKNVAKAYIRYRYKREMVREGGKEFLEAYSDKIKGTNIENQNANVDELSFGGRVGAASDLLMKQYALNFCVSKKSKENHLNNEIYIHDLSAYATGMSNCLSIPFDEILAKGFNTRQTDVRPANSVNTAMQLIAVIFQLQSLQQFGGVAATHIDWTLVPYVRKSFNKHYCDGLKYIENQPEEMEVYKNPSEKQICDISIEDEWYKNFPKAYQYAIDMTIKEIYQATEGLYHNLNTLQSRSGNQLPFTSLNYGTCILSEGRMITKALLEVSIEGLGKLHKTSIFPCGIFQYAKGINSKPGEPNYDLYKLALKSTSTRLYPNYANIDWTGNVGYDKNNPCTYFATMGQ